MSQAQHLLRRRGEARRRYKDCRDPLTDSLDRRIAADASRARHLARKTFEKCVYSFATSCRVNVHSRTKHDIQLTVEPGSNNSWEENAWRLSQPMVRIEVTIAKARRWLHRVHYRGLSVLAGHFVFEVTEVIAPDKLKVVAARETPVAQLCLAEALAERDAEGIWHLQWLESTRPGREKISEDF